VTARGNVTTALCQMIEEHDIDLIILGTSGRTGIRKLLIGSVAEEIFRRATCPVLSIGPLAALASEPKAEFRRILFATDFSEESLAASPYAVSLAEENAAQLILLHVIEQPRAAIAKPSATIAALERRLWQLVPAEAELWCKIETQIVFGEPFAFPTDRILEVSHEKDADLIVMGIRPVRGKLGLITHLANTTAQILAEAACPVLTVRG
jgi:nucleotide-binding universal stress UspA family protein